MLEELNQIFTEYEAAVQELQKKRKPFDGVLGLGSQPGQAACHEVMDGQVEALCLRAAEEGTPEEIAALTEEILQAQWKFQGPEYARLMLAAIQRHTLPLIPKMKAEDRVRLAVWYRKEYPRRKRLPVQDQVLRALG